MDSNTISMNVTVVRSGGKVDRNATLAKLSDDVSAYFDQMESEESNFAKAVDKVFSSHPGAALAMTTLVPFALRELNAQPDNFSALSERLKDYIRNNTGERSSGALFKSSRGRGGGLLRWSDIKEGSSEDVEEERTSEPPASVSAGKPGRKTRAAK